MMPIAAPTIAKSGATPAEIIAHLREITAAGAEAGAFKIGDAVTIADRAGLPLIGGTSDEGIVIASNPDGSFLTVLTLMNGGFPIPLTVQPHALTKIED